MAVCTYIRKKSPFFWLKYGPPKDPTYLSSKVRIDDPDADYKLAKKINKIEATQLAVRSPAGWDWVPQFLRIKYPHEDTLRISKNAWNYLSTYFRHVGVSGPAALTRPQVFDYLDWRTALVKQKSGRSPKRNTALWEMRMLGRIMKEAVARQMAETNPADDLNLRRDTPDPAPEILPDQQDTILDALESRELWMRRSFRIGLQSGLRFDTTRIDVRRDVDWATTRITIPDPKGGTKRAFTFEVVQLSLIAYLREIKTNCSWAWTDKTDPRPHGVIWREFFDDLGMPEIHFHCTRVTFITWCHRNRFPEPIVMQLVNHASTEIHRIYCRLNAADARVWRDQATDPYVARALA